MKAASHAVHAFVREGLSRAQIPTGGCFEYCCLHEPSAARGCSAKGLPSPCNQLWMIDELVKARPCGGQGYPKRSFSSKTGNVIWYCAFAFRSRARLQPVTRSQPYRGRSAMHLHMPGIDVSPYTTNSRFSLGKPGVNSNSAKLQGQHHPPPPTQSSIPSQMAVHTKHDRSQAQRGTFVATSASANHVAYSFVRKKQARRYIEQS